MLVNDRGLTKGRVVEEARRVLGEGLITSEGPSHHRMRRLLQPAFSRQRLDAYTEDMVTVIDEVGASWEDGQTIDVHRHMLRLALRVASRALFSRDLDGEEGALSEALETTVTTLGLLTLPGAKLWEHLPLPRLRRFHANVAYLNQTTRGLLEARERDGNGHEDFAGILLRARREHPDEVSDEAVTGEFATVFLAALETTASALSWTWCLLSQHPEAEARLHAELAEVLGGRRPAVADLESESLPYVAAVIQEVLRLYPPVWALGRHVVESREERGVAFEVGSLVFLSQWVTHHDERWYPDPFRFEPERWLPERRAGRPRYAYFPFGGGARQCIGAGFAWQELQLAVAVLAQQWRLRLAPGFRPEAVPAFTLRPRNGMQMTVARR